MSFAMRTTDSRHPLWILLVVVAILASSYPAFAAKTQRPRTSSAGTSPTEFRPEWVWSTFGPSPGFAGLEIVDVDRDGEVEILASADGDGFQESSWYVARLTPDGLRQVWSSFPYPDRLLRVAYAEEAERPRVVVLTEDRFVVYEGATHNPLIEIPIPTALDLSAFVPADVDADGDLEICACDDEGFYLYDLGKGALETQLPGLDCTTLDTGQLDGDAALEIVLGGNAQGTMAIDGATLEPEWTWSQSLGFRVHLANVDDDEGFEVLLTDSSASQVVALDPPTGAQVWSVDRDKVTVIASGDTNDDGDSEIILGYTSGFEVIDERSGSVLWAPGENYSDTRGLAVADLDGDGTAEIAWGAGHEGRSHFVVVDPVSRAIETEAPDLRGPFVPISFGDLDAVGRRRLGSAAKQLLNAPGPSGRSVIFDWSTRSVSAIGPPLDPSGFGSVYGGAIGPIDADTPFEVCMTSEYGLESLQCRDLSDGSLQWLVGFPAYTGVPLAIELEQVDADPGLEILAGTADPAIYAFEAESGWLKWRTPIPPGMLSTQYTSIRTGDVLGDAGEELVGNAFDSDFDDLQAVFSTTRGELLRGPFALGASALDLAQLDDDAKLEIVVGTRDGDVALLDPEAGVLGPPLASLGAPITALRAVDVTRDGATDIVVIAGGRPTVLAAPAWNSAWTGPYCGPNAGRFDRLYVHDADGDGLPEISLDTGIGFAIFDIPLFVIFVDGFEDGDVSAWTLAVPRNGVGIDARR